MDNKFIRFYNQNRQLFWIIVCTIIAVIVLIHILNSFIKGNNIATKNTVKTSEEKIQIEKNYSVVTGKQLDTNNSNILNEFLDYCNNGKTDLAYNLLSNECKEILYPSVESFKENYCDKIFNAKKTYTYQAIISNNNYYTYQINISNDMLATGNISKSSIIDYYTIIENDNVKKLNINKFICKKNIEKIYQNEQIDVELAYKLVYYDYEIYSIKFKNNKYSKVALDSFKSPRNIYIEDEKGNKYFWANYEYGEDELVLNKGIEKNLNLKFNKEYKPSMKAKKIVFQNVILNNQEETSIEINI